MEGTTLTLATLIEAVGTAVTGILGWAGDIINFGWENPITQFGIVAALGMAGFAVAHKLIKGY